MVVICVYIDNYNSWRCDLNRDLLSAYVGGACCLINIMRFSANTLLKSIYLNPTIQYNVINKSRVSGWIMDNTVLTNKSKFRESEWLQASSLTARPKSYFYFYFPDALTKDERLGLGYGESGRFFVNNPVPYEGISQSNRVNTSLFKRTDYHPSPWSLWKAAGFNLFSLKPGYIQLWIKYRSFINYHARWFLSRQRSVSRRVRRFAKTDNNKNLMPLQFYGNRDMSVYSVGGRKYSFFCSRNVKRGDLFRNNTVGVANRSYNWNILV